MTHSQINIKQDIERFKGVWVLAEQTDGQIESITYELLGEGRRLADELGTQLAAVLLGCNIADKTQALIERGADKVYLADSPELAYFADEPYAKVLSKLIRDEAPAILLCGATTVGRSLAPQVAIAVNTGLTADCIALAIDPETRNLLQTRPAYGGNVIATIATPEHRPQIATVRQKVMKEASIDASRQGVVINIALTPDLLSSRTKRLRHTPSESTTVNISEANILVAGGRGLQKSEHFDVLGDLAKVLKAGVAASRAAVDSNWISYAHQVGQTGKTVCPKLYIACGISGQIQHLAGMASAETIVAINRDPDAPIFKVATYGVVGDAMEIVPRLTAEFKKILGR